MMKKNLKLSKALISTILIGSSITGVSILLCKNNSNSEFVSNNQNNLKQIRSNIDISNDFRNFDNKQNYQIWNTNKSNNIYKNWEITKSDQNNNLRAQIAINTFYVIRNYEFVINNLNNVKEQQLKYLKDNDLNKQFDKLLTNSVKSVWSTDQTLMPYITKPFWKGTRFLSPKRTEDLINQSNNLLGSSLLNNDTRKWNYYAATARADNDDFNPYQIPNPMKESNFNTVVDNLKNTINKEVFKIDNKSFNFSKLVYSIPEHKIEFYNQIKTVTSTSSNGRPPSKTNYKTIANFYLYDNTDSSKQNGSVNNKTFNNWYSQNWTDYNWTKSTSDVGRAIGNFNTVNQMENIYVDFSKLINVDENRTTTYTQSNGNTHTSNNPPQLFFGWNTELFASLKEASLLAAYVRSFYNDWTNISTFSNSLKSSFEKLVNDIYNEKADLNLVKSFVNQVKTTNGVNTQYISPSSKANYVKILESNNWDLQTKSGNIGSLGIGNMANEISNWSLAYDYVLPQIFKNDIYAHYNIQGSNADVVNELNTKIFDGRTKEFKPLTMIDYGVQKQTYNNEISMNVKNFYMKDRNTNEIISGYKSSLDDTLNARNIYNVSKNAKNHKITQSGNDLKVTWKWNPGLNLVSNIATNRNTKALETPWYFASQYFTDGQYVTPADWAYITRTILKIPSNVGIAPYSFKPAQFSGSSWNKYKDLIKSNEAMTEFDQLNSPHTINTKEFYNAKRKLDNLGYIYLDVESEMPLNYYLTDSEYKRLQEDHTFIENGKNGKYYKYFVKYSFKAKPLKLTDLNKYISINYTSTNSQNPNDKFANKKLSVIFDTQKMKQDLAGMKEINMSYWPVLQNSLHEFFDVTYDELWTEVLKLINEKTNNADFKLDIDSFKYSINGNSYNDWNNWFYQSKWNIVENSDLTIKSLKFEATVTVKYKNMSMDDLASKINITQGDITVSELGDINEQWILAQTIQNEINNLRIKATNLINQFPIVDLKLNQQKLQVQKLLQDELKKNEELNIKFNTIMEMYESKIKQITEKVKSDYEEYKKNNKYESNGFVSSTLNKTFDYKKELIAIKTLYEEQNKSLNGILSDVNLKKELKDKITALNNELTNEISKLSNEFIDIQKNLNELNVRNKNIYNYANSLVNFNANQNITIDIDTKDIYLANTVLNGYWISNSNDHYQYAISQNEFINKFNELVNGSISPFIGMNINFTLDMFKLSSTGNEITGFKQSENGKTANITVKYNVGSNKLITKLQLEISVDSIQTRNSSLNQAKQKLEEIKKITSFTSNDIKDFSENLSTNVDLVNYKLNTLNEMSNVNLPSIFGTSEQAHKLEKLINEYEPLSYSKTKLNDAFIGTLIASIVVGILGITGLIIFLLSLRRRKTVPLTEEEIKEIDKAYEEFGK